MFVPSVKRGFRTLNLASAVLPPPGAAPPSSKPHEDLWDGSVLSRLLFLAKTSAAEFLDVPPSASFDARPYLTLLMNLVTQLVCVSGVNQMTSVRLLKRKYGYGRSRLTPLVFGIAIR